MSPELVGGLGFGVLLLLMFLGIPIAYAMIGTSIVGIGIISGFHSGTVIAALAGPSSLSSYTLAVLPLFLIMGEFADISGMMRDAFKTANAWLGSLRGGLAMASIGGAAIFSAVSGSSMACAALMARTALPQLLKNKYDPSLASGALAAGGTLGNLIPPGILPVFYAIWTESSIGELFAACLIPGALLVLMYWVQIYIQCKRNPSLGPPTGAVPFRHRMVSLKYLVPLVVVFGVVMGGIWFGIYTVNEAAAIGTVVVLVYAIGRRTVSGQNLRQAFTNTLSTSGMAFALIIGATIFTSFMATSELPQALASWLSTFDLSKMQLVIVIMALFFILGIPMDPMTVILLTLPIFLPVLKAFDVDLVWFGVLVIVQAELANISPPVGLNLFVIASIGKPHGITLGQVFRGSLPFNATMVVFLVLLVTFPSISMFLVNIMRR